jgi:hypothetical protein
MDLGWRLFVCQQHPILLHQTKCKSTFQLGARHRHGIANMYATEIINKYFYERTNPGKAQVYLD